MNNYDVIIIGAGAAGLFCALTAAKRGRKTLIIEHSAKIGEKIRISGGGRCNFTNIHTSPQNFISKNPHFCISALSQFSAQDFIALVEKHGIKYHEKTLGQLFCDNSSKEIIAMLLNECQQGNVEIRTEASVKKIAEKFILTLQNDEEISCKSLVIASGGLSIPKIGASSFGHDVARQFGLDIIAPYPALVPLTLFSQDLDELKSLSGVSFPVKITHNKISFKEALLITHRGLSGPAILQISSYLQGDKVIEIDILPDFDAYKMLLDEKKHQPRQEISAILAKHLPKRFAEYFAQKYCQTGAIANISNEKLQKIAKKINSWQLKIAGDEGYSKAEVTGYGVNTDEISSKTFECKKAPGLYFIGEVLDVTGHLGGFNFQFAWSSGFCAGKNV